MPEFCIHLDVYVEATNEEEALAIMLKNPVQTRVRHGPQAAHGSIVDIIEHMGGVVQFDVIVDKVTEEE